MATQVMEIIDKIREQKNDFIKVKGYEPDVIVFNSKYEQFNGKTLLGMTIETSKYLDENGCLMYRSIDLDATSLLQTGIKY